jgi:hypothetical protein
MPRVRAPRYILVRHGTLRIVDYPRDGVYSLLEFDTEGEAYRYLQQFSRNSRALERLEELLDEDDDDDEDEDEEDQDEDEEDEEEDDAPAGRSRPIHTIPKQRDILAEVAELIAEEELGVAEEVHRTNPPLTLDKKQETAPQEQPPTPKQEKKLTYIEIKIMDDQSGKPVNWVRLVIKTPDGNENYYTTDASGLVRIDDLDPGTCDVRCELKDAKLSDTLGFVGEGKPQGKAGGGASEWAGSSALRIAEVEEHKVKAGETLAGLAASAGMKWQDLAKFNWNTDQPDEINKALRTVVGCTKKTKDGKNYVFDDSDDPGVVLIPKKWEKQGLATGTTHDFRVKRLTIGGLKDLKIRLFDPGSRPMPGVHYKLTLAGKAIEGNADDQAWLLASAKEIPEDCQVEWDDSAEPGTFKYSMKVYLNFQGPEDAAMDKRLHNLGYHDGSAVDERVKKLQADYGLDETGKMDDVKEHVLSEHDKEFAASPQLFAKLASNRPAPSIA